MTYEEYLRMKRDFPQHFPRLLPERSNYDDGFPGDGSPYEGTHEVWVSDGNGGLKKVDRPNNSFD